MARSKIKPQIPENHPVAQAVAPLRAAATAAAKMHAEAFLASVQARIAAEPDRKILAPSPNSRNGDWAYARDREWRHIVSQLSRLIAGQRRDFTGRSPELIEWNPEGAAEYLDEQIRHAEHNYIVFVLKLIKKVEAEGLSAVTASIVGTDDAWTQSEMTVSLSDGTSHVWRTKQIWNTSVYGKVFAQYPTRVVKGKK